MKKQFIVLIALLALVSMMIAPVCAETLTGTLGSSGAQAQSWYNTSGAPAINTNLYTTSGYVHNIQTTAGLKSIIRFDTGDSGTSIPVHGTTKASGTSPVVITLQSANTTVVGTGTIGYQRYWDGTGTEQAGFQYIALDTWNITGLTGEKYLSLWFSNAVADMDSYAPATTADTRSPLPQDDKQVMWGCPEDSYQGLTRHGKFLLSYQEDFLNSYTATKPGALGLGISGVINKTISGTAYGSKATIYDGITNLPITSDNTVNTNNFIFNVPYQSIKISLASSYGTTYNSSILFTPTVPTVTPTPTTVTPTPTTTIPAGYVRNNLYVWDQNDAQIAGADVDVRDVESASWTNTTADADGWITIDTLPYHTVNVYAHYPTAGIYLPNEILGLETGYYGGHNWVLVLYPYVSTPSGFVTLYINTRNYDTKAVLTGVNLQIKNLVTGATTGESTGSMDSVTTVVTNATNYQITGSKLGYLSKTININSGEGPSKTVVVELSRVTVTPTVTGTPLPGEITARPSYAPGCDPAAYDAAVCTRGKDSDMMNQIRDAGPGLIGLAIIATAIGLIKLMSKR